MSENYYENPTKYNPNIVESHVASILDYVASFLFPEEYLKDKQIAYNRILLSDVTSGSTVSLGDAYQFFKSMFDFFPFVAYNVGTSNLFEEYGNVKTANSGFIYNEEFETYVYSYPAQFEVQFVAFFNDSLDHRKALSRTILESSTYTQLSSPVYFGDKIINLPIKVNFQIEKGDLASELEQYLTQNRIWNFNFNITALYSEFILEEPLYLGTRNARFESTRSVEKNFVSKVEIIESGYRTDWDNLGKTETINRIQSPASLKVLSTNPTNESLSVPRNTTISIVFNKSLQPKTLEKGLEIFPWFENYIYFNATYTTINIEPTDVGGLASNTEYSITVNQNLLDENQYSLESNLTIKFRTQ